MIAYHGTPLGGTRSDTGRFFQGRHALVPFGRQEDLGAVAEFAASFVFDNGAFTAWQNGEVLDVEGYVRWCDAWHRHPGLDWCLLPDRIDGTEEDNDALIREWPAHLRALGVPVFHLHESVARLERLMAEWPRIAIGSSGRYAQPGSDYWWARMAHLMGHACDERGRPLVKLHGLRMLSPNITSRLPFASADSTNAAQQAGRTTDFGFYVPATKAQRAVLVAEHLEATTVPAAWQGAQGGVDLLEA